MNNHDDETVQESQQSTNSVEELDVEVDELERELFYGSVRRT